MKPALYTVWHLNLMYSSIEVERRKEVIQKCFWPLIDLARKGFKPGIEAPGLTLEIANELDPAWVQALRECWQNGSLEFIGSGYSQLIAPLVPYKVNRANITEGQKTYQKLLGAQPTLWMANEQTYSRGLAECLLDEKIQNLIVDWSNPFSSHPEWDANLVFSPQKTKDVQGRELNIVWSDSLAFQKFQRCVHQENVYEEYESFLKELYSRMTQVKNASFCIYGNDAEIFDFRPGRFATEPQLDSKHESKSEWARITDLLELMLKMGFDFILPSESLKKDDLLRKSNQCLELTSLVEPNSVKKQPKYNVTRWAVTGRGSAQLNQRCYDLANEMTADPMTADEANSIESKISGRELCELWSSDYRTHITEKRWSALAPALNLRATGSERKRNSLFSHVESQDSYREIPSNKKIHFDSNLFNLALNPLRGLSLESYGQIKSEPILGRYEHGHFSRIDLSADWYSGNAVLQLPGRAQSTDLKKVQCYSAQKGASHYFQSRTDFAGGELIKTYDFSLDSLAWRQEFYFNIKSLPVGSLRFGFLTLKLPVIEIQTHLGGKSIESFQVGSVDFDHGQGATSLVSSQQALGMTAGEIRILTKNEILKISIDAATIRPVAMIENKQTREGQFFRLYFTASEYDETRRSAYDFSDEFVRFTYVLEER